MILGDRKFLIEFWDEDVGHDIILPWLRILKITTKWVKPHPFSKKKFQREVVCEIYNGCSNGNRVNIALGKINEYINREEKYCNERQAIEKFCLIFC